MSAFDRRRRRAVALALAVASALAFEGHAHATVGPGCSPAAPCADQDGDGFGDCACAPAGATCDCDDRDPSTFPGAPEACDATKDRNCSGGIAEPCGEKRACSHSICAPNCIPLDDFGCAPYAFCENRPNGQLVCAGRDCSVYGCPPGATCDDAKTCISNCSPDVRCPIGQRCRGFGCVDPCEGVVCAAGAACSDGWCVPSCDCVPADTGCAAGETCDRSMPVASCIDKRCAGVVCAAGSHCAAGACIDDCAGVVCPTKRVCKPGTSDGGLHGSCVDLCSPDPCKHPLVCEWRTGACVEQEFPEAGLTPVSDTEPHEELFAGGAGFTCTSGGMVRVSATGMCGAALAFVVLLTRRSRRRR